MLLTYNNMSLETKTMKQHIVPKAHIKRFEKNGKIIVHAIDENRNVKYYTSTAANVCKFVNFYDDDPYAEKSIEKFLKGNEDNGQRGIDNYFKINKIFSPIDEEFREKNKTDGFRSISVSEMDRMAILKYISMLFSRSLHSRIVAENLVQTGQSFGADEKITHSALMKESENKIMSNDLNDMTFMCCTSVNRDFLIADLPVHLIYLRKPSKLPPLAEFIGKNAMNPAIHEQKELMKYYMESFTKAHKHNVFFCPISNAHCLVAYRKDYENFTIDFINFLGPDMVTSINKLVVEQSFFNVYSGENKTNEIASILQYLPPISKEKKELLQKLKKIQKNH